MDVTCTLCHKRAELRVQKKALNKMRDNNLPLLSQQSCRLYSIAPDEFDSLVDAVRSTELIPYEDLGTSSVANSQTRLDALIVSEWTRDQQKIDNLFPPLPWDNFNRSFSYRLHAMEPVTDLLRGHTVFGDQRYLSVVIDIMSDWVGNFQSCYFDRPLSEAISDATFSTGTQAWYDMAVGQRVGRMAYAVDAYLRQQHDPNVARALFRSVVFQMEMLARDNFFASHTNHGLYQAIGQLRAARRFRYLPGFDLHHDLAIARLKEMIGRSFFTSGAHKEHSPGYHFMVLQVFLGLQKVGLLDENEDLNGLLGRAEECLAWMIKPNSIVAPIGDTDPKRLIPKSLDQFRNPMLLSVLRPELACAAPPSGVKVYHDAGYVFARVKGECEEHKKATYFAQIAGFHSRVHKHADHLSFIWNDRGHDILTDPGRFAYTEKTALGSELHKQGFWYSDPRRIYVEKTRSHNCVEIDGLDYRRARATPSGSSVIHGEMIGGLVLSSCETTHFDSVRHWRAVMIAPGDFLLCLDFLYDQTGKQHDFKQWFQVDDSWLVEDRPYGYEAEAGKEMIQILSLSPSASHSAGARGQETPHLQGWTADASGNLLPSTSLAFTTPRFHSAQFATLFQFGRSVTIDRYQDGPDMSQIDLSWSVDGEKRQITASRGEDGRLSAELLAQPSA